MNGEGLTCGANKLSETSLRFQHAFPFSIAEAFLKRVNGELTAFNTIEIIKRYRPKFWIVENPAADRLWPYIEDIIGFRIPYKNLARYNNYDYPLQKRTIFGSNIELNLKNKIIKQDIEWKNFSKSYNERSNIPEKLVSEIFEKIYKEFCKDD